MIKGHDHPPPSQRVYAGAGAEWVREVCAAIGAQCYPCIDAAIWEGVRAWEAKGLHVCAMAATMALSTGRYTPRMDPTVGAIARMAATGVIDLRRFPRPKRDDRQNAVRAAVGILCSVQMALDGVKVDFPCGERHPAHAASGLVGLERGFAPDFDRVTVMLSGFSAECETCLAWAVEGMDRDTLCALAHVARSVPPELTVTAPPAVLDLLLHDRTDPTIGMCATLVAQTLAQGVTVAALARAAAEWALAMQMPEPGEEQP